MVLCFRFSIRHRILMIEIKLYNCFIYTYRYFILVLLNRQFRAFCRQTFAVEICQVLCILSDTSLVFYKINRQGLSTIRAEMISKVSWARNVLSIHLREGEFETLKYLWLSRNIHGRHFIRTSLYSNASYDCRRNIPVVLQRFICLPNVDFDFAIMK